MRYQTGLVDEGPIVARVTASGALSATVTVQVGSQVSGRIDHLYVDYNSLVKAGQLIATIEPSFFRAAVEQGQPNLVAAHAAVDKAVASRILADLGEARQKTLSTRASSREPISTPPTSRRRHRTPIAGIILSRTVDVGQTVAASFQAPTLFTVARDLTRMEKWTPTWRRATSAGSTRAWRRPSPWTPTPTASSVAPSAWSATTPRPCRTS